MKTQQFIKEHTFIQVSDKKHLMYGDDSIYIFFDGGGMINKAIGLNGATPKEFNTVENLIITYLDDLYLSEFEEIKSYHEDTTK